MSRGSKNRPPKLPEPSTNSTPTAAAQIQQASFSGPIPPPAILEDYDRIVPGAAERILAMAEADAKHQREIELAALQATDREVRRGQIFGFTIGVLALVSSVIALYMGSPTVAGIIGGTTVVGLVSAFIIGRVTKPPD